MDLVINTIKFIAGSAVDVLPIAVFLFGFQWLVIGGKLPNSGRIVVGFVFVVIGLGLFLEGLEQTLFPLGRLMAAQLTDPNFLVESAGRIAGELTWQDFYWVYIFAAAIGFSTTMAEPSLIAVSMKANSVSAGAIGVLGLPLHYFIAGGYVVVIIQTVLAPRLIVPLAYDSGGVTTSTVTVPLVTALGLGLAEAVPGRSPLLDGFGLVAFASLFPIITVLAYGQLAALRERVARSKDPEYDTEREDSHAL